jgi:hypothetical protein
MFVGPTYVVSDKPALQGYVDNPTCFLGHDQALKRDRDSLNAQIYVATLKSYVVDERKPMREEDHYWRIFPSNVPVRRKPLDSSCQ